MTWVQRAPAHGGAGPCLRGTRLVCTSGSSSGGLLSIPNRQPNAVSPLRLLFSRRLSVSTRPFRVHEAAETLRSHIPVTENTSPKIFQAVSGSPKNVNPATAMMAIPPANTIGPATDSSPAILKM